MAVRVSPAASPVEANNTVLTTTDPVVVFAEPDDLASGRLDELIERLGGTPGLAAASPTRLTGPRNPSSILALLRQRLRDPTSGDSPSTTIVAGTEALRDVGGFNPLRSHLDWPDLIARLAERGWIVDNIGPGLPFIDELHPAGTLLERLENETIWLDDHGRDGPLSARRFRAMLGAVLAIDGRHHSDRAALAALAANGVDRPKPHEVQQGTGRRADWRFLLPEARYRHLVVLLDPEDERSQPAVWEWLKADGWADSVTVNPDVVESECADVVLAGGTHHLDRATAILRPGCPVVLERSSPISRSGSISLPGSSKPDRFVAWRRYLARPSITHAAKLIPLDHPAGLDWLAESTRLPLPSWIPTPAAIRRPLGSALAGTATMLGPTVSIGFKPPAGNVGTVIAGASDLIVMTSGFDEGSRAVLLPLSGGSTDDRPQSVIKVASRPRYNVNSEQELAMVTAVRSLLSKETTDLVTDSVAGPTLGSLAGSTERYVGSRTLSALLFSSPAERRSLYDRTTRGLVDVARDLSAPQPWSDELFDRFVAGLMERYIEIVRPPEEPILQAWLHDLELRSQQLTRHPVGIGLRHFDLGPWNIMVDEADGAGRSTATAMTIIDWEIAHPRSVEAPGLVAADLVYFTKYWLHIAQQTSSFEDELEAFAFLDDDGDSERGFARDRLARCFDQLGTNPGFIPLYSAHIWLETALYTLERRRGHGLEPGSSRRYLETMARHRRRTLEAWPVAESGHPN